MQLKDRAGKTIAGLEGIEERLAAIEKRLAALEGKAKPADDPDPLDHGEDRVEAGRVEVHDRRQAALLGEQAEELAASRATRSRSAPGTTSNRAGVVPRPRRRARAAAARGVDVDGRAAHHLDLAVADVAAAVELRRSRHEVELRDVADQHDVEDAVVGVARPGRASSRRRASARSRRSRRASGRGARRRRRRRSPRCSARRRTRGRARSRTSRARRAPSTSSSPARATAPLMPTEPTLAKTRRRLRAVGAANVARPTSTAAGAVDRDAHRVVEPGRDAVRPPEVLAGAVRQDGDLGARPGDAVHDLVQRPVAADDDEQLALAGRARARARSGGRGRSDRSSSPSSPSSAARARSFGQRFAVEPFALAGLTRKTTGFSLTRKG